MAEGKRGKLRSVTVRPTYDEKGKISGHSVSADHEPADNKGGYGYMPSAESVHESQDDAMAKATEHMNTNKEKFSKKGGRSMREVIGSA